MVEREFLFPRVLITFLLPEIKPRLEQGAGVSETLGHSLRVEIENGEGSGEVFVDDGFVERGANAGEMVNVGLNEKPLLGIKHLQIMVEYLLRHGMVEGHCFVVVTGQHFSCQVCRLRLLLPGLQLQGKRRSSVERRGLRRRRQGKDHPQQFLFHLCSITRRQNAPPVVCKGQPSRWLAEPALTHVPGFGCPGTQTSSPPADTPPRYVRRRTDCTNSCD